MSGFNFDNLFIIGEKEKISDTEFSYSFDLCTLDEELNEICTCIWDNEAALLEWKNVNAIEYSHCSIDFRSFCSMFILKNSANVKWMLLNPPPDVTTYKLAENKKIDKLMLFSAFGSWLALEHFLSQAGFDDDKQIFLKQLASENLNLIPNEFISNISELTKERLSFSPATRSNDEQFENDYKLKHVVISDIKYWDVEREEFIQAELDLFGHCLKMTITDNKVTKGVSSPDNELQYQVEEVSDEDYFVILNNYDDLGFLMSSKELDVLKKHYSDMNNLLPQLRESFKNSVNLMVSQLLNDEELVEMGKRFVDELSVRFYTDIHYLMMVEYFIEETYSHLGKLLLMSTKEPRLIFLKGSSDFVNRNSDEVVCYLGEKLAMFTQIVKEKIAISDSRQDFFITYVFIYNIVIEHLAKKWENEHKQYFQDIQELNLDEAIARYCSIETVVHGDEVSAGKFIYYLIAHKKFEKNNRNYLDCREIFATKFNKAMENKKYNNFVKRLKTSSVDNPKKYTINDVDLMDGREFEKFIAELFSKMGYESEITKASGDQGIDVIASKNGNTIGIQAKCYSSSVGNSAIQEVVAGKGHYRLDKAIVITNNFFTDAAQQLAQSNSVILWDRSILKEKIDEIFNTSLAE